MRIIPVLDLKAGLAVRAVGGERDHYRPVASVLHGGPDPLGLALAFRDRLGLKTLYLADLDTIAGAPPALNLYRAIADAGINLWVDAGMRTADDVGPLVGAGVGTVVLGLETLGACRESPIRAAGPRSGPLPPCGGGLGWGVAGPQAPSQIPPPRPSPTRGEGGRQDTGSREDIPLSGRGPMVTRILSRLVRDLGPSRLLFSLDLRDGDPIVATDSDWPSHDSFGIAEDALSIGIRRLLLLDLARVGKGEGVGTLPLLKSLRARHPDLEVTVGGGVAGRGDLEILREAGASAVLVGSALHDGRIGAVDLRDFSCV